MSLNNLLIQTRYNIIYLVNTSVCLLLTVFSVLLSVSNCTPVVPVVVAVVVLLLLTTDSVGDVL